MSIKLFILGSCVSRDAFGPHNAAQFQIADYVARTVWGSAFATATFDVAGLDNIKSPFQRRMVELDSAKGLSKLLVATTADLILLDLIDERFDIFIDDAGASCTVSPELLSSGFQPGNATGTLIPSGSRHFFELWERGWCRLLNLLNEGKLLNRVRINRIFWSTGHEDGSPFTGGGHTPERIALANRYLERLYERLAEDLRPEQFIEFPRELMTGALNHRWGSDPFHYVDGFYSHMASALLQSTSTVPSAMQSAYASPSKASADAQSGHVWLKLKPSPLTEQMQWHDVRVPADEMLQFDCRIQSEGKVSERRALMSLECRSANGTLLTPSGFALSPNKAVGNYRYLGTGQGSIFTSFNIALPVGTRTVRVGVRSWMAEARLVLQGLCVSSLTRKAGRERPSTILSVDVEALLGRAERNSVERLIFGRFGDGKTVGIERLCDMFDHVGAKATFFIDYSTCDIHGEKGIFAAAELLKARGQDVQLHMHSEVLVRQRRWPHKNVPTFDNLDVDVAQACLEYGIDRFQRNLGVRPRIFRPGGMKHSKKMVLAVKKAGIEAVSSLYRGHGIDNFQQTRNEALFRWDNGVLEAPLDFALDPLIESESNRRSINELLEARTARPLASILLHSTSLLFRALDNNPTYFTGHSEDYEKQLREYLEWFAQNGDFITYSDLIDSTPEVSMLRLDHFYPRETASVVPATEERHFDYASIVEPKPEPLFNLAITVSAHRPDNERLSKLVPATQLPLKLAPGQRLGEVIAQEGPNSTHLIYVLSGQKAYLMRQRCVLPGGAALESALSTIFQRHPRVTVVLAQSALEDVAVTAFSKKEETRRTYVLDLPASFEDYRKTFISKKHRSDIERKERTVQNILPGLEFISLTGPQLNEANFLHAAQLIEARLKHKVEGQAGEHHLFHAEEAFRQWDSYRHSGEVVQLWNGSEVYAAALCLHFEQDCFFMASGHLEAAPRHSLGNILLYRLIESLITRGVKRLHLGGGDFEYKSRYGALERPLWNYEFTRSAEEPLKSLVVTALASGESPALLEEDLAMPLESILSEDFETVLGVDFNAVVENDVLGTDGRSRRYQATARDAFVTMMKHVPFNSGDIFVDVGCGKGKMLYYASQLGYRRCIGLEIAEVLLHQARANFECLQLPTEMVLLHRDASAIPMADLEGTQIFYLYNPFSEGVLRGFLHCLLKSQQENPRRLWVVYCNALFEAPFVEMGFQRTKIFVDGEDGWRFGHAAIYERHPAPREQKGPSLMISVPSNIAKGRVFQQSSVSELEQANPASINGAGKSAKTGRAIFTTQKENSPWWRMDLGQEVDLDSVVVYNWDIVGLPYSAAGRSRARYLQIWGSQDAVEWQLLHDRRNGNAPVSDFGGIHNGPLFVPLSGFRTRHLKLTLAGGGILQLEEVQVYVSSSRDIDDAIQEMMRCAAELNFAIARRILNAVGLPLTEILSRIQHLGIRLNDFSKTFLANVLIENHLGEMVQKVWGDLSAAPANDESTGVTALATSPATPVKAAPLLSIHMAASPLPTNDVMSRTPPIVPPASLPLELGKNQQLLAIEIAGDSTAYVLEGRTAELLRQGCFIENPAALQELTSAIFARHPKLERITVANVTGDLAAAGFNVGDAVGFSYILDLPADFEQYRQASIFPRLLAEIDSHEQSLQHVTAEIALETISASQIEYDVYERMIQNAIETARGFSARNWQALRPYIKLVLLKSGDELLASACCLEFSSDCQLLAMSSAKNIGGVQPGELLNILQLRLIADLIQRGYHRLQIDCRDSALRISFGAVAKPHYSLRFERGGGQDMSERVKSALASGKTPAQIEADIGLSLEEVLRAQFEETLRLDFDAIVENGALGTDTRSRRYQPTIRDAFFMMMKHVPFNANEVFVDVGSGKSKMLYYAYLLGYQKCVGMEISPMLLEQAKINFERLQLPVDIRLWQRDASNLDLAELAELSLFYLSNPFGEEIMDSFLRRLVESQKATPRALRIVYCVAIVEAPFNAHGFTPVKVFEQGEDGWRFARSVIYERNLN